MRTKIKEKIFKRGDHKIQKGRKGQLLRLRSNSEKIRINKTAEIKTANERPQQPAPSLDVALPLSHYIIHPNRIRERRLQKGYETAASFLEIAAPLSVGRLRKIESGQCFVRESEYELIAKALGIRTSSLKLPVLSENELHEWKNRWGTSKDGAGSNDSVVLAAYIRHLAHKLKMNKSEICEKYGYANRTVENIWFAKRSVDSYCGQVVEFALEFSGKKTWTDLLLAAQDALRKNLLNDEIKKMQQKRGRITPGDPDERAPWTYETNPNRKKVRGKKIDPDTYLSNSQKFISTRQKNRNPIRRQADSGWTPEDIWRD